MISIDPEKLLEESGAMWARSRPRDGGANPVLFYQTGNELLEFSMREGRWAFAVRELSTHEHAELLGLYGSEGIFLLRGSSIGPTGWVVRGFIKDGRRTGWSISVCKPMEPLGSEVLSRELPEGSGR